MKQILFFEKEINSNGIYAPEQSLTVEGFKEPLSVEETIEYLRNIANELKRFCLPIKVKSELNKI